MTNEYGIKLDSNGYAPSVVESEDACKCFHCGRSGDLVRHEVFHGSDRQKAKALGCWVHLCPTCHNELHSSNPQKYFALYRKAQIKAMSHYGWTVKDFRKKFGKNYI